MPSPPPPTPPSGSAHRPTDGRTLRVGLLAPELPPMLGGMSELSRCLGRELARCDTVRLFALPNAEAPSGTEPTGTLSRRPWADLAALRNAEAEVDCWLAMNAGLAPLARHLERPFAVYLHGNDFLQPWLACGPRWLERVRRPVAPRLRLPLRRRAIARALPRATRVLTNSRQTRERILELVGDGPRNRRVQGQIEVQVHSPGVDDAFFQPLGPPSTGAGSTDDGRLRLLTVSRLTEHTRRKNVDGVLRALARLRATGRPDDAARPLYDVVGDGDDRPRLEALAASLGLEDDVRFLGAVTREELLAAYRRADLFVLASRATEDDVEGFGIVYMEASAAGTPVLASRAGGAVDAVVEGENGLLVERSDPETLAGALRDFKSDQFAPERVRAVAERYRWPRVAEAIRRELVAML